MMEGAGGKVLHLYCEPQERMNSLRNKHATHKPNYQLLSQIENRD